MRLIKDTVLVFVLLSISLLAQDYSGKGRLAGKVCDEEGKPLERVKVRLLCVMKGSGFETATDADGNWKASWIKGGMWFIDFEKLGYSSKKISIDVLERGKNPLIEVKMQKLEGLFITEELKQELFAGNKLFKEGKYLEAKNAYEAIATKYPDAYIIQMSIGNCYFQLEDYAQAESSFKKVLEKDPKNHNALLRIGNCYANRGETERAMEWYSQIEFEKIADPLVLYNIGTYFYNGSKFEQAIQYYKKAIEIQENFLDGIYQLGLAYLASGNSREALVEFENYLKHDPDSERAAQIKNFVQLLKDKK